MAAVREKWIGGLAVAAERIAQGIDDPRREVVGPVDARIVCALVAGADKSEQVRSRAVGALVRKIAAELIFRVQRVADSRVDIVLIVGAHQGRLIVVPIIAGEVRQRIEGEQSRGLRADSVCINV